MKKIISVIILVFMTAGIGLFQATATDRKLDAGDLNRLISRYQDEEGFEVVKFGNIPLGLVKLIANATASEEDKKALELFDGINKFIVVEYYGASSSKKTAFIKDLSSILDGVEKIVEVKDSGDSFEIYGSLSKDGEKINNVVINTFDECSLVCFFGTVKMKDIGEITKMTNE